MFTYYLSHLTWGKFGPFILYYRVQEAKLKIKKTLKNQWSVCLQKIVNYVWSSIATTYTTTFYMCYVSCQNSLTSSAEFTNSLLFIQRISSIKIFLPCRHISKSLLAITLLLKVLINSFQRFEIIRQQHFWSHIFSKGFSLFQNHQFINRFREWEVIKVWLKCFSMQSK